MSLEIQFVEGLAIGNTVNAEDTSVEIIIAEGLVFDVTAGVITFNARDGDVVPQEIDYAEFYAPIETVGVQSKVDFFALAEQRKRETAGSGFIEFGKHYDDTVSGYENINEGMFCRAGTTSYENLLALGSTVNNGISRTDAPIAVVDGNQLTLSETQNASKSWLKNIITLPDAPNGTKTYNSETGVVFDYANEVDPKYGDVAADTNEAVARAFEGDGMYGDLRDENSNNVWEENPDRGSVVYAVNSATITDTTGNSPNNSPMWISNESLNTVSGETYQVEILVESETVANSSLVRLGGFSDVNKRNEYMTVGNNVFEFTAGASLSANCFLIYVGRSSTTVIKSIVVKPITEKVIISRQDLVFLETWHEKLSEKDIVCPLGNVQYGATSFDGVSLKNTNVVQGYSAFGEWDSDTKGYSAVWSDLTTEQKKVFIDNPENNIYFDSESNELIQVRYRIRVVEGQSDVWQSVLPNLSPAVLRADNGNYSDVSPQGMKSSINGDFNNWREGGQYLGPTNHHLGQGETGDNLYVIRQDSQIAPYLPVNFGHDGKCFAMSIALVQRLNQGAYHAVYNPSGCRKFAKSGSIREWHGTNVNSTTQCFTQWIAGDVWGYWYASGSIGSAQGTGRSDQYEYYDAIYAGQVQDLRLNANKQDYNRLLEDAVRRGVAGETRGKGKVPFTKVLGSKYNSNSSAATTYSITEDIGVDYTGGVLSIVSVVDGSFVTKNNPILSYNGAGTLTLLNTFVRSDYTGTHNDVISYPMSAEFDTLPWIDIIGDPDRIAATFPDGVVGQWIPEIPDGVTDDFPLNVKSSGSTHTRTYTTDNGATWTSASGYGVDATANTITFSNMSSDMVYLAQYETLSNFTESDDNRAVIGQLGDVQAVMRDEVNRGNRLAPSLVGVITKHGGSVSHTLSLSVNQYDLNVHTGNVLSTTDYPKHSPTALTVPDNGSNAVKALPHLVEKDGLLYIQYHGTQLVYDAAGTVGGEWGDTTASTAYTNAYGEVTIVDDESTKTDLNGNIVKVVTHTEINPIGIADYTQTN